MLQFMSGVDDFVSVMKCRVDIKVAPQKPTFEDDLSNQMGDRESSKGAVLIGHNEEKMSPANSLHASG